MYFLIILIPFVIGFFAGKSIYRKKYKQQNSNILNCLFIPKSGLNLVAYTIATHKTPDRKSTRLNSSHSQQSRMPSSA